MPFHVVSAAERPELVGDANRLMDAVWEPFMQHDPVANRLFGALYSAFAESQFFLLDEQDAVAGVGNSIPFNWERPLEELPEGGWDWVLQKGFEDQKAGVKVNLQSGISITLSKGVQGEGLSPLMVKTMRAMAQKRGAEALVVPIRPTWKARYPLVPIEEYMSWTNAEGLPFDPWLRVHVRLGGRIVRAASRSMVVRGTVAEWEEWTGMRFSGSGPRLAPGALVPVEIDRERDLGTYVEPNVWVHHAL